MLPENLMRGVYSIPICEKGQILLLPLNPEDRGKVERVGKNKKTLQPEKMLGVVSGGIETWRGVEETPAQAIIRECYEETGIYLAEWQVLQDLRDIQVYQFRGGVHKEIIGHGKHVHLTVQQIEKAKRKRGIIPLQFEVSEGLQFLKKHGRDLRPSTYAALLQYLSHQETRYAI